MVEAYQLIYQGQLSGIITTLTSVPGSTAWILKHISVINNDSVPRSFSLYRGGTDALHIITPNNFSILAGGMAEWDGLMSMAAGETIAGGASVASQLTITICGDQTS